MNTIYYVISLPRTGTSSISKMSKIVGFKPQHPPHTSFVHNWTGVYGWNFFSDTPTFCPKNIEMVCNSDKVDAKFIFIDRDFKETFDSWVNVGLYGNYLNMLKLNESGIGNSSIKFDFDSYTDAFGGEILTENNYLSIFNNHKSKVLEIVDRYKKPILIYNFNMGWEPFCEFTNTEIPFEGIPHINKNKMYDKI